MTSDNISVIALIGALITALTELIKRQWPTAFEGRGERVVALTAALGIVLTVAAYALGQLPDAQSVGDAVKMALATWLVGNGLYAVTKPIRKDGPPRPALPVRPPWPTVGGRE